MNSVHHSNLLTDPFSVLKLIDPTRSNTGSVTIRSDIGSNPPKEEPHDHGPPDSSPCRKHPFLKLVSDSENDHPEADVYQLDHPPTPQVEQLVGHLKSLQKDLAQREADLQKSMLHWDKQVLAKEASLRKQQAELDQHLAMVNRQQEQLLRLQQNLVSHQDAIRQVVEQLVDDNENREIQATLESLLHQLNYQSDIILTRWERLMAVMN